MNNPKCKPSKRREIGQKTAEGVASAALRAFFAVLLSAIAAAGGGYPATPKDIPARTGTTAVW